MPVMKPPEAIFADNPQLTRVFQDVYDRLSVLVQGETGETGATGPGGPGHVYVEKWQDITPGNASSWEEVNLSTYGVSEGETCEIVFEKYNITDGTRVVGVREVGSALDRKSFIFDKDVLTVHVKASGANATIEVFTDHLTEVTVMLAGYWTTD